MRKALAPATLLLLLVTGWPRPAQAVEFDLELGLFNRFALRAHEIERLLRFDPATRTFLYDRYLTPANTTAQYSFLLRTSAHLRATSWLSFGFVADSGEVRPANRLPRTDTSLFVPVPSIKDERVVTANGRPIKDEAKSTLFIRQAYVAFEAPKTRWFELRAGRLAGDIGRGLIYDDFGLGGQATLDFGKLTKVPLLLQLQALLPTRSWDSGLHSPLLSARLAYVFSSLLNIVESVGLTVAYFHDGDGNFGQLLQPALTEVAVVYQPTGRESIVAGLTGSGLGSSGNIVWLGLDGRKLIGDFSLYGAVFVELGSLRIDNPLSGLRSALPAALAARVPAQDPLVTDTFGVAVDVQASYLLTEKLALGAFLLFLSGEDNPFLGNDMGSRYSSFLGVVPFLRQTNLFFSGGLNETFSGRQAATSGVNGRGVIAVGPTFKWDINDDAELKSRVAPLWSAVKSHTGKQFYGVEFDVSASWMPWNWLRLSAEYDVLVAGGFFPQGGAIHKLIFGVDVVYGI